MSRSPQYVLRPMRYEDIAQVVAIDRLSFPIPWTASVYRYEIGQNSLSSMAVLCLYEPGEARNGDGASCASRLLNRLLGRRDPAWHRAVVGYGGFWFSRQEAHISTIATHPSFRGRGLGEALLAGMIRRGLNMGAGVLSLEVRVSNEPAIALYQKYEFHSHGRKERYYHDNGEDAYDMRVSPVDDGYRGRSAARWEALQKRVRVLDEFSAYERPRRSLF